MSLLSYNQICELIEQGVIEGAKFSAVNSASLDIHLGDKFIFEDLNCPHSIISFSERESFQAIEFIGNEIVLEPGDFCLAQSKEIFHLPNNISCEYMLKSSMARIALNHLNAGWCDAGWNGSVLTMEFINYLRKHSIKLEAGEAIGQIKFFRHEEVPTEKSYATRGRYNEDKSVSGVKIAPCVAHAMERVGECYE